MAQQSITGAKARLKIDGVFVGYATGVSVRESIDYQPVAVLGRLEPAEHAAVSYSVSGSMRFVRIEGNTMKEIGAAPLQGTSPATLLANVLNAPELVIEVEDLQSGRLLMKVERAQITTTNFEFQARQILGQNIESVGLYASE